MTPHLKALVGVLGWNWNLKNNFTLWNRQENIRKARESCLIILRWWHIWNDDSENDPYKILWLTCKLEGARQRGTKSCQVMPDNHLIIVFNLLAFDSIMNPKVTYNSLVCTASNPAPHWSVFLEKTPIIQGFKEHKCFLVILKLVSKNDAVSN